MYKVVQLLSVAFLQKEVLGPRQRLILVECIMEGISPGAVSVLTWGAEKMVRLQQRAVKRI